jgi:hypothetical protein
LEPTWNFDRILRLACALLLAVLAVGAGLKPFSNADTDTWTHLALGREVWERKVLDFPEPFLGWAEGKTVSEVAPHHPLFELLLYGVFTAGGEDGIHLLVALLALGTVLLLWRAVPPGFSGWRLLAAWTLLLLVALLGQVRFQPRPEMLSYLMAALALPLAWGWKERPSLGRLALLAALVAAWSAFHVSWTVGMVLAAAPLLLWPRPDFLRREWSRPAGRAALLLLAAAMAAGMAGALRFALVVAKDLGGGKSMANIIEMLPLWNSPGLFLLFAVGAGFALLLAWGSAPGRARRLALAALAALPALAVTRNLTLSLIAMVPPALDGLRSAKEGRHPFPRWAGPAALAAGTALFLAFTLPFHRGLAEGTPLLPRQAAAWVKRNRLPATVMNPMEKGGYLNWAWRGNPPTYLDGRNLGDNRRYLDHLEIMRGGAIAPLLEKHRIHTILTYAIGYFGEGELNPLFLHLLSREEWKLVHASDALVFTDAPPPGMPLLPRREGWVFAIGEAQRRNRGRAAPHLLYSLGVSLTRLGEEEDARRAFTAALRRHPELAASVPAYAACMRELGMAPGGPP